ncbi:MAG TPA: c-type cytochrome [Pirellulales bacterium]|nr:c-type cytochrome [Pirellulales bacterium]
MKKSCIVVPCLLAAVCLTLLPHHLLAAAEKSDAKPRAKPPEWIWSSAQPGGEETVYFRKTFQLDQPVARAALAASCDNSLTVFLNGQEVASSAEWQQPARADVAKQLVAGENVLAVRGQNHGGIAALLVKLDIKLADGARQTVASDRSWLASSTESPDWKTAAFAASGWKSPHSFGRLGVAPWGDVLSAATGGATPADTLEVLPGFQAELIYSVPKPQQGSWVSMTFDHRGRIIASDQSSYLYRVTPGEPGDEPQVEQLDVPIGQAQGLLYAYDSLYVVVNGNAAQGSGLYRVRDTDGDDRYDEVELLKKIPGGGEHGPHAVVLGPEGKLYVIAGNHTKPLEGLRPDSPHRNWAEDLLLPRQPDANGHATGVMAPGGWIVRTDKDGGEWTLICGGFRNAYDMAFNIDGELFAYDADMEWDVGAPWYRPTRVNHCVSAAEFGWRYGTGKWPAYYADSLPGFDIGLGSPTGIAFGTGAKFPERYQRALFVLDWSYGKIYAMHLTPHGASYQATFEPFVSGRPLPVTDVAIGPDGAMYFTVGGRGTQSGLYRVRYVGSESTAPAAPLVDAAAAEARALRHKLESFHGHQDPAAAEFAWPHLNSQDRYIRYAARMAVEHQDPAGWQERALAEKLPTASIQALLALARVGQPSVQPELIAALGRLPWSRLSEEEQLDALRVYQLAFIRLGKPDAQTAAATAARLEAVFPSQRDFVNRELCQLLVYLQSPSVVAKSMKLLHDADTQGEQMHYVFVLRGARRGWNEELRRAYFSWFNLAGGKYQGGHSFKKFLENIRKDAVETLSDEERVALRSVIEGAQTVEVVADEKPRQFVHNWQMADIRPLLAGVERGRSFESGKAAFRAAQCLKCHRFAGDGGAVGHDLTGAGNRFSPADILESILLPSKVVSDQYASQTIVTTNGTTITGAVSELPDGSLSVMQASGDTQTIGRDEIEEMVPSKLSIMPEGLLSNLTKDEVLDLIAYLRSGGKADDKAFGK